MGDCLAPKNGWPNKSSDAFSCSGAFIVAPPTRAMLPSRPLYSPPLPSSIPPQVRVKVNIFFKEALTKTRLLPLVTILGDKKISRFRPELSPTETMNVIQEFIDVNR